MNLAPTAAALTGEKTGLDPRVVFCEVFRCPPPPKIFIMASAQSLNQETVRPFCSLTTFFEKDLGKSFEEASWPQDKVKHLLLPAGRILSAEDGQGEIRIFSIRAFARTQAARKKRGRNSRLISFLNRLAEKDKEFTALIWRP